MKQIAVMTALVLLAGLGGAAQAPKAAPASPDPWASARFLVGSWTAKATGGAALAQSAGNYSFRFELAGHVLARHAPTSACTAPDESECRHNDLLYLYPEGSALKAIYFDNAGHVIHYDVSTPQASTLVLLSDAAQPGPQYRLTYSLAGGVLAGKFEMKLPGQTDFISYQEWSGKAR